MEGEGLDAVVVNASGCGTTVKDYGHMFREEPAPWAERAARVVRHRGGRERGADPLRLRAHARRDARPHRRLPRGVQPAARAAAHRRAEGAARQGGVRGEGAARRRISAAARAGTYNILQPEIAGRLRERKLENLGRTGADLIATGNIGCITQLADGALPVVHSVELLDWMAGGPEPGAVAAARARRTGPAPASLRATAA